MRIINYQQIRAFACHCPTNADGEVLALLVGIPSTGSF
jgi:hypothetical protein